MGWFSSKSPHANREAGGLGIDLNATRARAATGRASRNRIVLLDDPHPDLPLAISLEHRTAEVGRAGLALVRKMPHLTCRNFLPHLGQPQEWKGGRHRLDAVAAATLALEKLLPLCGMYEGIYVALPTYLTVPQVSKLNAAAAKVHFPIRGTATSSLALAADRVMAQHTAKPALDELDEDDRSLSVLRPGKAGQPFDIVIVDADEHALISNLIRVEPNHVALAATSVTPRLSARLWKDRLLDALADRCVRACRRDPRDSAEAEQALFEQIDDCLDRIRFGQKISLTIRSAHWFQDLVLRPEEFEGFCTTLVRDTATSVTDLITSSALPEPPRAVWMTHEASRLPGLGRAFHRNMSERTNVGVLRPEAVAVAMAGLGERWQAGDLPNTHLDTAIPISPRGTEAKAQSPAAAHTRA
jgi:hypothetical protein